MKRTSVLSIIAAVLVSALAGCATAPNVHEDLFSFAKTYSGGDGGGSSS